MPDLEKLKFLIDQPGTDTFFRHIYGESEDRINRQKIRYTRLIEQYRMIFGDENVSLFSTPGRTEIGGNHTDHNAGRVLAASVNLDSIAVASRNEHGKMILYSEGFSDPFIVDVSDLARKSSEDGSTTALLRGIAFRFKEMGYSIGGFHACMTSDVLVGSGLSSSASIEVLIGTILNALYNDGKIVPEIIAQIGQFAENRYFKKPCGLMDQMTCAVGGIITIDFRDGNNPIVEQVNFDFASQNYSVIVVDTGGNHADLTDDYAAIPTEMRQVAGALGGDVCRDISMESFIKNLPEIRKKTGDRALLRAYHFITDNERVLKQVQALEKDDFKTFLNLVSESGQSSFKWLQNCFTTKNVSEQGVTLALALTEDYINGIGQGACRVHGGGFAGTIQVFLPNHAINEYIKTMTPIFGEEAISILHIRPRGTLALSDELT